MLRRELGIGLMAILLCLALPRTGFAEEPVITGIVTAAKADADEAATLKAGKVVYKIKKDANGKKVAAEAKDKKVEIKGPVVETNGVKWITVTSCKIVE